MFRGNKLYRPNRATPALQRGLRAASQLTTPQLREAIATLDSHLTPENAAFGGELRQNLKRLLAAKGGGV